MRKLWHRFNSQPLDDTISKIKGRTVDMGCGKGVLISDLQNKGCEVYGV